jgi:hypothetical protein
VTIAICRGGQLLQLVVVAVAVVSAPVDFTL